MENSRITFKRRKKPISFLELLWLYWGGALGMIVYALKVFRKTR